MLTNDVIDLNNRPLVYKQYLITLLTAFLDPSEGELEKTTDLSAVFGQSINGTVGQHAFAQMEENPDSRKIVMKRTTTEQRIHEQKKR